MLKQIEIEKISTTQITSMHSSFDSERYSWQEAYFQIMAYQNTYDFAYTTAIHSTRDHEAYLWILLHPNTDKNRILEWLSSLGYSDLKTYEVTVGELNTYDLDIDYIAEA
jgi:uncharacterized protein (DUF2225 family)